MDLLARYSSRRWIVARTLVCLALLCGLLSGMFGASCKRRRRPKPQTEEVTASRPVVGLIPAHLETRDPAAASQLLKGFYKVEDSWRWTAGQFSVLLGVPKGAAATGGVLKLRFAIPDVVLARLHEQTISATINGKPLGPETYRTSGSQTYTRAIPPDLLTGPGVQVDFTVNPVLPPGSADMRELAVIASSISLEAK